MPKLLEREIERLKDNILSLGKMVEENVEIAVKSFEEGDTKTAMQIMESDVCVDNMEIEVEEECLKILALHQPVAIDLRFIIAVLKINSDLERIGDLAVNIAERTLAMSKKKTKDMPNEIRAMAQKTVLLLRKSLKALVTLDYRLAVEVCAADDEIDAHNMRIYDIVRAKVKEQPSSFDSMLVSFGVGRQLERIADHATNIAEDVIYMVKGEIVRHHTKKKNTKNSGK